MSTQTITPKELQMQLQNGSASLIDVRTPAEFREVHVNGAKNVPLDQLDPSQFNGKTGRLLMICKSGKRGQQACEKLSSAGIQEVYNVEGGTEACVSAGLPVERGKQTMSIERQVRIAAGSLVVLGVALSFLHIGFLGISGFVGAGLVFAGVTDTCAMGMMIAKMPWNK